MADDFFNPVLVTQSTNLYGSSYSYRDIIRTSSGRIYYFIGKRDQYLPRGWIEAYTSEAGVNWEKGTTGEWWNIYADISVAIDSKNVIHIITYNWDDKPIYFKYDTLDSSSGVHAWKGFDLLESNKSSSVYSCSIAVDANDIPHVVYLLKESYKGKDYLTLHYANKIGGVWNKKALWPKEKKASFTEGFDIALGPDNVPYISMGKKMLKGNTNNPSSFEEKDLGFSIYSFVIHQNGDVRVSIWYNGKYAHYVHDHTQQWGAGWTLYDSGSPFKAGKLQLVNDIPHLVYLENGGLWIKKNFEAPILIGSQPSGGTWETLWDTLLIKWHFYNNHFPDMIDIGIRTNSAYLFGSYMKGAQASFSASPMTGISPLSVNFTDNSITPPGRTIASWQWDFDDDGTIHYKILLLHTQMQVNILFD